MTLDRLSDVLIRAGRRLQRRRVAQAGTIHVELNGAENLLTGQFRTALRGHRIELGDRA